MRCDIVIPVWNQPVFTRDCIDSIGKNTAGVDYRIIIIDNASDSDTKKYLEGLARGEGQKVLLHRNERNTGFIRAANCGISLSDAPYICILNNDTITSDGWLGTMIDIAESGKDIGIVNPSSNNLGQRPERGEPIERYASSLSSQKGRFVELGTAIGFCMLIKREVIDRIGVFDEVYGMGNFEDTDFSRRAVKEGYRCVRACGAYVYHRENTSFKRLSTFEDDFRRNREIFEFRWGRPRRIAYILDLYDSNLLKKINSDSVRSAREGNWVWYFMKERIDVPEHSNIIPVIPPAANFYIKTTFDILKKKKKFDEIFVGEERFGRILERLAFIHKAKVSYY
jgi:GT2 family glycosyltransferase